MDELNILKEEIAQLKQSLDKEQIVNDKLMHTVMRQRVSWMNVFVKSEFIILPITFIIFVIASAFFGISQWYAIAYLIIGLLDAVVDLRTFRISPKIFSTCSMMEVRKLLIKQKKERFIHLCISFPIAIIWLVLFAKAVFDSQAKVFGTDAAGYAGIFGGIIGAIIGVIIVMISYRKAQKTNDTIIDDLKE